MSNHLLSIMQQFRPDWQKLFSVPEAERELHGFKFNGVGWYLLEEDSILVAEASVPVDGDGMPRYLFCVYNNRNPIEAFKSIATAPIRQLAE